MATINGIGFHYKLKAEAEAEATATAKAEVEPAATADPVNTAETPALSGVDLATFTVFPSLPIE